MIYEERDRMSALWRKRTQEIECTAVAAIKRDEQWMALKKTNEEGGNGKG